MSRSGRIFPAEVSIVQLEDIEPPMFTGFIRDLTELDKTQQNLRRTIADLRRSNEDLEHFAFSASHDLQEPLRTISLYTSVLQEGYADRFDDEGSQVVQFVTEAAQRMRALVQGLLDYSRVATRGRPFVRYASGDAARAAIQNLETPIRESGAVVSFSHLPEVVVDPVQLERIFMNLLGNAVKFRGETSPRIEISARDAGDSWEFEVRDNGIGFDAGQTDRNFLMFQRLHERSKYEGTGIGLPLTRRIIERHGGEIWAEAEPGRGACFTFKLPKKQEAALDAGEDPLQRAR
jgi:light-regulated signal transduction histidine kinase (bacteriophytochrome)